LDKLSSQSSAFINTISSYGLHQLVSVPTHKAGHLLDVVISSHKIVLDLTGLLLTPTHQKTFQHVTTILFYLI
jgi:hypothetical protein